MSTQNLYERKRISQRFAGFYLISLALIGTIFAALFVREPSPVPISSSTTMANVRTEHQQILAQSDHLQSTLKMLQEYDDQYNKMVSEPGSENARSTLQAKINSTEASLSKGVEDLGRSKALYGYGENAKLVENISNLYLMTLNGRTKLRETRRLFAAGNNIAPAQQELMRLTAQLNSRDQEIADLKSKPENTRVANESTAIPDGIVKENESLRNTVADSREKAASAAEQVALLKKENTKLTEKLNDLQRVAPTARADAGESSKIKTLSADLNFSQVDCNLTRADAKQIISNARQRRELLNEALTILNNLTKSENPEIRKKAAEKISALNYIAKNIRE